MTTFSISRVLRKSLKSLKVFVCRGDPGKPCRPRLAAAIFMIGRRHSKAGLASKAVKRQCVPVGSLTLLHPWLLVGLVGASLPILIHLIGRRRAPTLRFAAFDFLVAVNKRLARRERLRQLLLLLMRTLALIALALAVARPTLQRLGAVEAGSRRLAIVLDASASMAYEGASGSLFDDARGQARDLLTHLQPGDMATVIVAGAEVRSLVQAPTLEMSHLRKGLDELGAPAGVADLGTAIDTALVQLGEGRGATLVIISDLSQNSFEHLRPTGMDPPPEIRLLDAAGREQPVALGNLAIEATDVEPTAQSASERRFRVLVRNYGGGRVEGRAMELIIDDVVTHRAYIDLQGRSSDEKVLTHSFDNPGVYRGRVRLEFDAGDGYAIDDEAMFVVEITAGVQVLVVNGDPRTTPHEDELFFLERALGSIPRGDPPIRPKIIGQEELAAQQNLDAFDVILLANVGSLTDTEVHDLRDFLHKGGGLFIGLGANVNFEAVNERFADLLPHPLRDIHQAEDPNAGTAPLGMGDMDWDHPILQGLGLPLEESLRASRTARYFNLDVGASRKARPILAFDNGAPALIEGLSTGKGRSLMLTTTLDVDFSDLALRSAFPALMQRSVRYLARAVQTRVATHSRVGGTVEIPVPTGARGVALVGPSGQRREVLLEESGGHRVSIADLSPVGFHKAEVLLGEWARTPTLDVAVSPSLVESDFMPVRPQHVSEALGGDEESSDLAVAVGLGEQDDPFALRGYAPYLLLALCFLFVGESLLASRG